MLKCSVKFESYMGEGTAGKVRGKEEKKVNEVARLPRVACAC